MSRQEKGGRKRQEAVKRISQGGRKWKNETGGSGRIDGENRSFSIESLDPLASVSSKCTSSVICTYRRLASLSLEPRKFLGVSNTNTENSLFFVSEIGFVNFSMAFAQKEPKNISWQIRNLGKKQRRANATLRTICENHVRELRTFFTLSQSHASRVLLL